MNFPTNLLDYYVFKAKCVAGYNSIFEPLSL